MTTSHQRRQAILIGVCLAVLIAAVYWPVGHAGFINYDDNKYVTENPHVQGGFTVPAVVWAFTANYAAYWLPLTWLSFALDYEWFGMNAGGYHAVNVLLHAADAVLLFLVLRRMTGATWRSACVAALFGVHPLHVESVAWIAERKDVLSGLFWLLALWEYVRYVERPTRGRYAVTVVWYAMGLMAKPTVITLPFVLLLLDYWPLGRTRWMPSVVGHHAPLRFGELVREKIPFFALAAVSCVLTTRAQHGGGAISSMERLPVGLRLANAVVSYVRYIEKAVWPSKLAVFYPYRVWPPSVVFVAGAILVAVSAVVIRRARREPYLAVGWFWFLGTLVPAIGLVQVGGQSMADRYVYLPMIGLTIMLCWSVPSHLLERWNRKAITGVAAAAVLVACAVLSRAQVGYWKDSETLFRHALDVTRDNWLAHNHLGTTLERAGKVEEAIAHFEQAVRINPDYAEAHNNLGVALTDQGKVTEAIAHYQQALRLRPDYAEAYNNLGNALAQVGKLSDAIGQYEQALRIKPDFAEAHNDLGIALAQVGRLPEAMSHYEQALRLRPDYADVHYNLGLALANTGRLPEAMSQYEQALRLRPDYADVHCNLGNAFLQEGKLGDAIGHYEQALRIKPDFAEAHNDLGIALAQVGRLPEAMSHYEQALRLRPNYADAHFNLGIALGRSGRTEDAIAHFEQALRIKPDYAKAHHALGLALEQVGKVQEAIGHFEQALRVVPDYVMAQNNLAWLLATLAPAEGGDPVRAVSLAERACQLTNHRVAPYLDTLAAAYAAAGRFTNAVTTAQAAIELARSSGQTQVVTEIQQHLQLYRSGRAYRPSTGVTSPSNP